MFKRILLLLIPLLIISSTSDLIWKYALSWGYSIYLFLITFTGIYKQPPPDKKIANQIFRPLYFGQLLLIGYLGLTSIFYFLSLNGYYYFTKIGNEDFGTIEKVAQCQFYVAVAHASLVFGLFIYDDVTYLKPTTFKSLLNFQICERVGYVSILLAFFFKAIGIYQLYAYLLFLTVILFISLLKFALDEKKGFNKALMYAIVVTFFGFATGMKEYAFFIFLLIGILLYEKFGRIVFIFAIPIFCIYFYFVPAINDQFRTKSWYGGQSATEALSDIFSKQNLAETDFEAANWTFLTKRFSEMSMFVQFTDYVPRIRDYYGWELIQNGLGVFAPRLLFPNRPSPDITAMQRTIDAGVLIKNDSFDSTSAKPSLLADAYLFMGFWGLVLTFFIIGWLSTKICEISERLFGGYYLGSVVILNAIFPILFRGGPFENMIGSIVYGFIVMYVVFFVFKRLGILQPNYETN